MIGPNGPNVAKFLFETTLNGNSQHFVHKDMGSCGQGGLGSSNSWYWSAEAILTRRCFLPVLDDVGVSENRRKQ